jgi:hypothetical protein
LGKQAPLLIVTDELADEGNLALARFLFGCSAPSCLVEVSSPKAMADKLRSYDEIGTLAFLLHGVMGTMLVRGAGVELGVFAKMLAGAKTTVTRAIAIESCNVGESPEDMVALMAALRAPEVSGYAAYHYWGPAMTVPEGMAADAVDRKLTPEQKQYLLPNQSTAVLVKQPGRKVLWGEWFSHDIGEARFPVSETMRRTQRARSSLSDYLLTPERAKGSHPELLEFQARVVYRVVVRGQVAPTTGKKENQ